MLSYRFWAHSVDGKTYSGVIQAESLEAAHQELEVRRLIPERVVPERAAFGIRFTRRPSSRAMVEFARQLATLIESAIPLARALEIVSAVTRDRPLQEALGATLDAIRSGSGVAEAMAKHPEVFGEIFVATVAAGERGGNLGLALLRMADYLERTQSIRDRVVSAMAYPAIVVVAGIASIAALLVLVVPTFEGIFIDSGMALPATTLLFVTVARWFARYWLVGAGVVVAALVAVRLWYRSERGRRVLDGVLLRLPGSGGLAARLAVARFSRTAASLLASGVPVLDALQAAARTCGNVIIAEALSRGRESVAAGHMLGEQLAREAVLPALLASMVTVGEQTGQLDRMLDKVADLHDREVQASIDGLLKVLEPALVIVVGVILGGIVVAMYLPIISAISAVG